MLRGQGSREQVARHGNSDTRQMAPGPRAPRRSCAHSPLLLARKPQIAVRFVEIFNNENMTTVEVVV